MTPEVKTCQGRYGSGQARVAEVAGGMGRPSMAEKAVLLSFRIFDNQQIDGAETQYFDKVPLKHAEYTLKQFEEDKVRVVPPAARKGAYLAPVLS